VQLMGGEIGVESCEGQGSTFWFQIPMVLQPAREAGAPARPPAADLTDRRVLVVDDNATNRQILMRQLQARGIQVTTAADGPAALGALRTAAGAGQPFDLAILDMQMPSMDGLMLARQIVADPAIARVALALLTSLGHAGHRDELEGLGFVGVLTKPIRQSQLWSWLDSLLGEHARVQAEPAPDLGVVLPVEPPPSTIAGVRRILVAEDNVVNQRVVVRLLERLGYRVDVVTNGAEAVHTINRHPYVAVLMDCQMPEMDGYEATRAIRAEELARLADFGVADSSQSATPRIPIIALTANAMAADRARCLASGMDDYLVKPLRPDLLAATLERWLPLDTADSRTPSDAETTPSRMAG
jgi:two-component system sensor histidine kinase/response regulator